MIDKVAAGVRMRCYIGTPAALVSVEQQRVVVSDECAGACFLFMFLPIGIWYLQPRLHMLVSETPFPER